jgi:hypothetical protein
MPESSFAQSLIRTEFCSACSVCLRVHTHGRWCCRHVKLACVSPDEDDDELLSLDDVEPADELIDSVAAFTNSALSKSASASALVAYSRWMSLS